MREGWLRRVVMAAMLVVATGCAARTPPALPSALAFPEFVYPAVAGGDARAAAAVDAGWRYLQNNRIGDADREFGRALERAPMLDGALAGRAYVALARKNVDSALGLFDRALARNMNYAPALAGRGQALLALRREAEALASFERALAADPSLTDLQRRVDVLRFRNVQDLIQAGRRASADGRLADARSAFERALAAAPDSALVHHELGLVERKAGNAAAAIAQFRTAAAGDATDVDSRVQLGELLDTQSDFAGALAAFREANAIEPSAELAARIEAASARVRDAGLPPELRAIATAEAVTRGDLAALIGTNFEMLLGSVAGREEVITDIQMHWAAAWIRGVARAGVMPAFDNHTFQPGNRLRRVDLAVAASRLLTLMAQRQPDLRRRLQQRPSIADVGARHANLAQVSAVVATGVMPLLDGNRFDVARPVTGAEALATIDRLRALAAGR